MISRTVKTSLLWKTRFSKILETCYTGWWQFGKCTRENKCTHGRFTCFISSEMFENEKHITVLKLEKHITVNFLQVIHRFVRDITADFLLFKAPKYHKEKATNWDPYSYPIYRIYHWREISYGEIARARIVTDEETEISQRTAWLHCSVAGSLGTACTTKRWKLHYDSLEDRLHFL